MLLIMETLKVKYKIRSCIHSDPLGYLEGPIQVGPTR